MSLPAPTFEELEAEEDRKLTRDIWHAEIERIGEQGWCYVSEKLWLIKIDFELNRGRWIPPPLLPGLPLPVFSVYTATGPVVVNVIPDGQNPPDHRLDETDDLTGDGAGSNAEADIEVQVPPREGTW